MKKIVSNKYFPTFLLLCAAAILFGSFPVYDKIPNSHYNEDIGELHHFAEGAVETINKEYLKRLKPEIRRIQTTIRPLFAIYLFLSVLFIIVLHGCFGEISAKSGFARTRSFIRKFWFYVIPALMVYLYITKIEFTSAFDRLSVLEQMPDDTKPYTIFLAFLRLHDAVDSMESLATKMIFLCFINSILLIIYALACSTRRAKKDDTEILNS